MIGGGVVALSKEGWKCKRHRLSNTSQNQSSFFFELERLHFSGLEKKIFRPHRTKKKKKTKVTNIKVYKLTK